MLRTKRRGFLRNVCVALGNVGTRAALPALTRAASDPEPLIAEHARWALLEAGGIAQSLLLENGVGPVALESTVRYRKELRAGDQVDVDCVFDWGTGKTFRIEQSIRKPDGTIAAEVSTLAGLMDLKARRLVPDPPDTFRALAADPAVLGL